MPVIPLAFAPEMEELIIQGKKCCTSRHERKGDIGDLFLVKDRLYRIVHIHSCALYSVRDAYYNAEGFSSPEEFQQFWDRLYPKRSLHRDSQILYVHFFAYVSDICPDFNRGCNSCIPDLCPASEVCNHG